MHGGLTPHSDILSHPSMYPAYTTEHEEADFAHRLELEAENRVMLLRCLVCKPFRDPALDALWWRLDNLVPLLRHLPCFVSTKAQRKGAAPRSNDDTLILKGTIPIRILKYPRQAAVTHIVAQLIQVEQRRPAAAAVLLGTKRPSGSCSSSSTASSSRTSSSGCRVTRRRMPSMTRRRARPGNRSVERLLRTFAERTPRLKTLEISTRVHPLCLAPLAAFTRIEHLSLRGIPLDVDLLSQTYREPLEYVPTRRHAPQLASIRLEIPTRWRTRETMGDLVRPLQDWTMLEHVVVKAQRSEYQVTEDDLVVLERWPKLSRLSLGWNARGSRAACGAVPSLSWLVLSLQIVFTTESYPVRDPKMVERYVFYLFPGLMSTIPDPEPSGWDQVLYWVEQWRMTWNRKRAQTQTPAE